VVSESKQYTNLEIMIFQFFIINIIKPNFISSGCV